MYIYIYVYIYIIIYSIYVHISWHISLHMLLHISWHISWHISLHGLYHTYGNDLDKITLDFPDKNTSPKGDLFPEIHLFKALRTFFLALVDDFTHLLDTPPDNMDTQSLCEKRAPPLCIQLAGCKSTSKAFFPHSIQLPERAAMPPRKQYLYVFFLPTLTTNMTHM